ncbi:glycine dehydrogenase (aminomethyl-transferring) [Candidatus Marinamargulisbacteria bacterium SCGC AG-410-N11]|nr:glycine dehydrogenase (aminomethyl-transferring) [Candidatus Marinamargulisbacteria bacterium SCGC AG-410-N11]
MNEVVVSKETDLSVEDKFLHRHIGLSEADVSEMLKVLECSSVDQLIKQTIPENILNKSLNLPKYLTEFDYLEEIKNICKKNKIVKSFIGQGYYGVQTPPVIIRNILENPSWYTQYTPYQPEISQGRLEVLFYFQTLVSELTGLPVANASLLDEGSAACEAMIMLYRIYQSKANSEPNTFLIADYCFEQTKAVLKTRAEAIGIKLERWDGDIARLKDDVFGFMFQYPNSIGDIEIYRSQIKKAQELGIKVAVIADLLSLTILEEPGQWGVDVVVGSSQRFGVPIGYGGPHAAFLATKKENIRKVPGRIIGMTKDRLGKSVYRMTLQTREQHIRKEKATSNICTAQALLAIIATMYAIYHGQDGLIRIANSINKKATRIFRCLEGLNVDIKNKQFFDTVTFEVDSPTEKASLESELKLNNIYLYQKENCFSLSISEDTKSSDLDQLISILNTTLKNVEVNNVKKESILIKRKTSFFHDKVFNENRTETKMLRFMKRLESKDLSLANAMIPLGSCTMKLNATASMIPLSWSETQNIHPFIPIGLASGYQQVISELEGMLNEVTGFSGTSLQPNSGAQGEYAGLLVIRDYFKSKGLQERDLILIPNSAHGTNAASAVCAGFKVKMVKCTADGVIDYNDLKDICEKNKLNLAGIMITYPSTYGVFDENIKDLIDLVHSYGAQVYLDGANMNAQVGLTSPSQVGADVCHLNLHKTFSIPHGGGGPGVGPICVASHLVPFLPTHPFLDKHSNNCVISSAPWGSASILLISYGYIRMLGKNGLKKATEIAILNANYIKERLKDYFPVKFTGKNGRVAHELIIDIKPFKLSAGIDVSDVAKRLIDYGFHAPTMSWPVPQTLMIEPTESESKEEIDRFCDALISIYHEIQDIIDGNSDVKDNVLKNAPHTMDEIVSDNWTHPYSRQKAVYPLNSLIKYKFWPSSSRVDDSLGDRQLICTCMDSESLMSN